MGFLSLAMKNKINEKQTKSLEINKNFGNILNDRLLLVRSQNKLQRSVTFSLIFKLKGMKKEIQEEFLFKETEANLSNVSQPENQGHAYHFQ